MSSVPLSRDFILDTIQKYGFYEIHEASIFLRLFCSSSLDRSCVLFLREKLYECVLRHDNGDIYFSEIHFILKKLDEQIYLHH